MPNQPLLSVRGLRIDFTQYTSAFAQGGFAPLLDVCASVSPGEVVAMLGASGSGKSLLAHAILGILPGNAQLSGEMLYDGRPLDEAAQARLRGREVSLIPQSISSLDPLLRVGNQLTGGHRKALSRAKELLARYGLPEDTLRQYPHELSGGMARRVLIASALMPRPRLVIADEPTPGLHPQAAQRVLSHLKEMAEEGAAVLLITHDLELALTVADRVSILYAGKTIEEATAGDFADVEALRHPYTRALWRAMPKHGLHALPGTQPVAPQSTGCAFAPRCAWKTDACAGEIPYRAEREGYVRCLPDVFARKEAAYVGSP